MSVAEEMGWDAWPEDEFDYISETDADVWETRELEQIPIKDLETSHLRNIIRGLESGRSYWGQNDKLGGLVAELNRRESEPKKRGER